MKIKLRCALPLMLLWIGSSLAGARAQAKVASKRTSPTVLSMPSQGQGALSVAFVSAPDGPALSGGTSGPRSLNLGAASYGAVSRTSNVQIQKLPGRFIVTAKFGLAVQDPSARYASAAVLAAIAYPNPAYVFRLNGVTLQAAPQIVQGHTHLGTTETQRLEIEVPTSLTEKNSQIQNAIIFQVIPN